MDPKQQLNQLDPKLKEAYERVMGTPVGTPPPPTDTAQTGGPTASQQAATLSATPFGAPPVALNPTPPIPQPPTAQPNPSPVFGMPQPTPNQGNPGAVAFTAPLPGQQPIAPPTPQQGHPQPGAKPAPGSHGFVAQKKGLHISPVLWIMGAIVFVAVYTLFWFKLFNIPIPFVGM
jgi:hypothetical protein